MYCKYTDESLNYREKNLYQQMNLSQLKQPHQKGPQSQFSRPTKLYLSGVKPLSSMSLYNSTAREYIIIFQKK